MNKLRLLLLPVAAVFVLAACDSDGDGLSNKEEKELGSDPDVADSDGDGLEDGAEAEAGSDPNVRDTDGDGLEDGEEAAEGTDPTNADSDGDGYSDFSEIQAQTDPTDSDDVIYIGGWPHNPFKDDLADPGLDGGRGNGDRLPRRTGKDQFGDTFDLYDLAGQGKPILFDISAEWCGPCRDMADWLEGNNQSYSQFNNVRRAVNRGEVLWVTVIPDNFSGGQATQSTVADWYEAFPHDEVPVVVDRGKSLTAWSDLQYFPSTLMLNEDLEIERWQPSNPTAGLSAMSEYCSDNGLGEPQN